MTCPTFDVVSTAYHEHSSATAISGTISRETTRTMGPPSASGVSRSKSAHWATKHSSAAVATERPTMTLENHVLKRTSRGMSNTGTAERNAQPNTYTAESTSCLRQTA